MIQTLKTLGVLLIAVILFSCKTKPTPQEAVTYNDKVVDIHTNAINSLDDITTAFDGTAADLQTAHKSAVEKAGHALDGIKKLGPFEAEKPAFYDAAVKYLTMHKQVLELEYKQVVDILSKEEVGDEDFTTVENLMKEAEGKYAKGDEEFEKAQIEFAKEYGFQIAH